MKVVAQIRDSTLSASFTVPDGSVDFDQIVKTLHQNHYVRLPNETSADNISVYLDGPKQFAEFVANFGITILQKL